MRLPERQKKERKVHLRGHPLTRLCVWGRTLCLRS